MEKKVKKLQLRKETIAVLNGERMVRVVGGFGEITPDPNNPTGYLVDTLPYDCSPGLVFNPAISICDHSDNLDAFKTRLNCPPPTIFTCYSDCQCPSLQGCLTKKGC